MNARSLMLALLGGAILLGLGATVIRSRREAIQPTSPTSVPAPSVGMPPLDIEGWANGPEKLAYARTMLETERRSLNTVRQKLAEARRGADAARVRDLEVLAENFERRVDAHEQELTRMAATGEAADGHR